MTNQIAMMMHIYLDVAAVPTKPQNGMCDDVRNTPVRREARVVHEKLMDGTVSVEDIYMSDVLNRM